jgi:hypothetical protein
VVKVDRVVAGSNFGDRLRNPRARTAETAPSGESEFRSLLGWAFGPRNFMKNRHGGIMIKARVGEVEGTVEKLRLLACLIRSMRALRE